MAGLRDAAAFQEKRLELQSKIMDAQSSVFLVNNERAALIEEIGELKKKVAGFETWETEKQRYELIETIPGVRVYSLKEDAQPPETPHQICAQCYQKGQKSILQHENRQPGRAEVLVCHNCGLDLYVSGNRQPEHPKPARR